ncbi:Protein IMPACT-A [Termitomyces sp. T112]|nr:hypothetical protein C0989_012114 [Termitomyces sp. Mn162]KAG5722325.1 Protein IMPACT-A [Termitomyces sp. T112]KAH0588785.1 hypothetical protein H2248_004586 [Termitomyces sp. 'cryptogamus']KNZ74890.1 Protein IMPACT-A [Termitomyces sp. J132]
MPPSGKSFKLQSKNNLDTYIKTSRPLDDVQPEVTSQEIRDRGSTFIANLFPAASPSEVRARIAYLKDVLHKGKPATHEIAAWRCMVPKPGRNGLGGPDDFELNVGNIDDGEKWAGARVQKIMESYAIIDAVVIVSRWYGGTMLGPVRFAHIETCAAEVCQEFKRSEELRECISQLTNLDAVLAGLRAEYSESSPVEPVTTGSTTSKDYTNLDLEKGRRLIKARENAIRTVKLLLAKRREATSDAAANLDDPT